MTRRTRIVLGGAALVAAAVVALGPRLAVQAVEDRVREGLGGRLAVDRIDVGWRTLELAGLRLPAPDGWPVPDALRVRRITLRPRLTTLLGRRLVIDAVEIDGFYLAARRRPGEPLEVLPGIDLPRGRGRGPAPAANEDAERRGVTIERVAFRAGAFDLFDATVATPPERTALTAVEGRVTDIETPALGRRSRVRLDAELGGPKAPGELTVEGTVALGAGTAHLKTVLVGVDLATFRPWLRRQRTPIRGGIVDVSMESTIRDGIIDAPGRLTIRRLSFGGDRDGLMQRLLALPRDTAFRAVTGAGGRVRVRFVLEGPLESPRLVISDRPGSEVAAALGAVLGAAPVGVAEGAGALGTAGATGLEATARGTARAIERLFSRER
ncbi:MAG: DUF748 domain-containing protein [bacterium]|nr:DUF748 domain-containing protein [bacterium]